MDELKSKDCASYLLAKEHVRGGRLLGSLRILLHFQLLRLCGRLLTFWVNMNVLFFKVFIRAAGSSVSILKRKVGNSRQGRR